MNLVFGHMRVKILTKKVSCIFSRTPGNFFPYFLQVTKTVWNYFKKGRSGNILSSFFRIKFFYPKIFSHRQLTREV